MALIDKKLGDYKYGAEFQLGGDATESPANVRINPELLYGAKVQLTIPAGAPFYIVGERVTQTSGGAGRVVKHDSNAGELTIMTERDSTAIFNLTDDVDGVESAADHNPSAKTAIVYRLDIEKVTWSASATAGHYVELLWDATTDERIVRMGSSSGNFGIDGIPLQPQTIAGQTGSINTITSGTYTGAYTLLVRVIKNNGFIYPLE